MIKAVPAMLANRDIKPLLMEIVEKLLCVILVNKIVIHQKANRDVFVILDLFDKLKGFCYSYTVV